MRFIIAHRTLNMEPARSRGAPPEPRLGCWQRQLGGTGARVNVRGVNGRVAALCCKTPRREQGAQGAQGWPCPPVFHFSLQILAGGKTRLRAVLAWRPWRARKRRAASPRGRAARHRRHLLAKLPQLGQRHVPAARVPADERLQAAAEGDWLAHDRDRLAGVARARVVLLPRRPRAVPRRGS